MVGYGDNRALALEERNPYADILTAGERLVCDWTGCLFWPREATLIVADLHLEKGSSFARKGMFVPPYDTGATLARLAHRVAVWQPKQVIALGDSFHDAFAHQRVPGNCHSLLAGLMEGREWVWISGNHDPLPITGFGGVTLPELRLGGLVFRHQPQNVCEDGEIAGHLHPQAKLHRRSRTVRRPCFAGDGRRLILPAFGAYTGGLNIRDKAFDGLFLEETLSAVLLGRERVFHIAARDLVG